jgi:hypothetical protein
MPQATGSIRFGQAVVEPAEIAFSWYPSYLWRV